VVAPNQKEYKTKIMVFFIICFVYFTTLIKPKFFQMVLSTGSGKKETIHKFFFKLVISLLKKKSFLSFSFLRVFSLLTQMLNRFSKDNNNACYFVAKACVLNNNLFVELNKLLNVPMHMSIRVGRTSLKTLSTRYRVQTFKRQPLYYNFKFLEQMKHFLV